MGDKTKIEWSDATWNPVRGCTKISPGCKHCYAETFAERWRGVKGHPYEQGFDLRLVPEKLTEPLRWQKPRRIFVNSMSDLFHEAVPLQFLIDVFGIMALAPLHQFQILTKRPGRMRDFVSAGDHGIFSQYRQMRAMGGMAPNWFFGALDALPRDYAWKWPLPNVHLGVSCENQETADERIPLLLRTPAAVRFVSAEPLLEHVDLSPYLRGIGIQHPMRPLGVPMTTTPGLDLVIVGGESGPGARPCDVQWVRSIVEQCKAAGVNVFVKQLGAAPMVVEGSPAARSWSASGATGRMDDCGGIHLRDRKGGDLEEWPEDLRVRESI